MNKFLKISILGVTVIVFAGIVGAYFVSDREENELNEQLSAKVSVNQDNSSDAPVIESLDGEDGEDNEDGEVKIYSIPADQITLSNKMALSGNLSGNIIEGSGCIVENEAAYYFVDDNCIYKQEKSPGKHPELLLKLNNGVFVGDLCIHDDYLYYRFSHSGKPDKSINRFKLGSNNDEIYINGDCRYSIYGQWMYYNDTDLHKIYVKDLAINNADQNAQSTWLLADNIQTDGLVAADNSIVYIKYSFPQFNYELCRQTLDGKVVLLADSVQELQVYNGQIYYLEVNTASSNRTLWRIDLDGSNKTMIYSSDITYNYIVSEYGIFLKEEFVGFPITYSLMTMDGKEKRNVFIYVYSEDEAKEYNGPISGVMEGIHVWGFHVVEDYIVLNGFAYKDGRRLVSRFPIQGGATGKKEEVFYDDNWHSFQQYMEK